MSGSFAGDSSSPEPTFDVVVIGGGPAGSAAARLLASGDHRVLLLTRPDTGRPSLAESLPPSSRGLLDLLGARGRLEDAGFMAASGNTVWWGSRQAQVRSFSDGHGWQAERGRLERMLLDLARDGGARVRHDATVREVTLPPPEGEPGGRERLASVRFHAPGPVIRRVRARFVLDCSGRAGVVARRGMRIRNRAPRTTALTGVWRRDGGWDLADETHTLVESYRDGWVWSVPLTREIRYFTAMVDPERTELDRTGGADSLYLGELRKTVALARLLEGARLEERPRALGATPYGARRVTGPGVLLVGDAGTFLDPLSSFGVKKALASGWLASVAVHTALLDPSRIALALSFFEAHEREAAESFHSGATPFYRSGFEAHGHPFWESRVRLEAGGNEAAGPDGRVPFDDRSGQEGAGAASGSPDVKRLRGDPRVLAAFEDLRTAERVDLRPSPDPRWTRGATVREGEVVDQRRLSTPSFPHGLRYLREIDAVRLVELAGGTERGDVPELHRAYERAHRPVPLEDFLGALSVLLAEGVLTNRAEPPGRPTPGPGSRARARDQGAAVS